MESTSHEYGKLVDQLRKDRKMTRLELVDGIMSQRSYQRFASGEVQVSNSKLNQLIDRLGLEYMNVKQYFAQHQEKTLFRFKDVHNLVMKLDYLEARVKLSLINKDSLDNKISIQSYLYLETAIARGLKEINQEQAIEAYKNIVDFPKILEFNVLNIIEFNILQLLNTLLTFKKDFRIIEFFEKFLNSGNTRLISLEEDKSLVIYAVLAKGYYNLEDYEKVLEVCDNGIEYSKTTFGKFGIINLYAYKASALAKMLKLDQAKDAMLLTYMSLLIEGNEKKTKVYIDFFEKSFDIKINELMTVNK